MRSPLINKLAAFFLTAIVAAVVCDLIFSTLFYSNYTSEQSGKLAVRGIMLVGALDDEIAYVDDTDSPETYREYREMLRHICTTFGLKYMYVKRPVENGTRGMYVFTVAADPKEDMEVQKNHPYGTLSSREFNEQEKRALAGDTNVPAWREKNNYGSVYSYVYPVKDEKGNVIALIGADYDESLVHKRILDNVLSLVVILAVTLLVMLAVLLFVIDRRVLQPLRRISASMDRFAKEKKQQEPLGIRSHDEIRLIADSYENMSRDILSYIEDIKKMTAERMQAGVQMDIARRIQCGMVPTEFRVTTGSYNAAAIAYPARQVGGDFYDCFESEDGICLVMGDVSGKGIGAALFMAMAKTMIREKLRAGMTPAAALNSANDELCAENPEGMFATVFAAVLDKSTGELRFANAGHTRPVMIRNGGTELLRADPGIALGLFDDAGICDDVIVMDKGDGMLLYTDGVTEAVSREKTFFGEERLLANTAAESSEELIEKGANALREFADGAEQFDDITALAVFFEGGSIVKISAEPSHEVMDEVKGAIFRLAKGSAKKLKIILACEEINTNIVSYSGAGSIEYICALSDGRLTVRICDNGRPFDPLRTEIAEKEFEEYDTGGMGINLVRQIAQNLVYRRIGGRNILKMVFDL